MNREAKAKANSLRGSINELMIQLQDPAGCQSYTTNLLMEISRKIRELQSFGYGAKITNEISFYRI